MTYNQKVGLILVAMAFGTTSVVLAAEQGGQTSATKTTSAAQAVPPLQAKEVQGSIATLDLQSLSPTLTLRSASGQPWALGVDPKGTTVWSGSQLGNLNQLKVGSQVKIRYEEQTGRKLAKRIELAQPSATSASVTSQPASQ